jgi:uncharacterized protein (TIGR03032 family)
MEEEDVGQSDEAAETGPVADGGPDRQQPIDYEYSRSLPALLSRLGTAVVVSTYQAGKVFTVGVHEGKLVIRFHHFEQAMGVARTPTGLAIGTKRQIWTLPAAPTELARRVQPAGSHDICLVARQAHFTGPTQGHDLAWCGGKLWLVNTLFNCLSTIEPNLSFVPRWRPPFITELASGDRCHLNGLASDDTGPRYVTVLSETDTVGGWREHKLDGGCLLEVPSGRVLARGLSMPHSPRLYRGELFVLNSGYGRLELASLNGDPPRIVATLPGYARGLDFHQGHAFVGLSRIRETNIFGGLPIGEFHEQLQCGLAVVDCGSGRIVGSLFFNAGVSEIFAVQTLPGYQNPIISGPYPDTDGTETIWMVPTGDAAGEAPCPC